MDIEEYEGFYQVSNLGRIKSLSRKRYNGKGYYFTKDIIMKQKDIRGYKNVTLRKNKKKKTLQVHRLVMKNFKPIENCKKYHVNHKNGKKFDNRLENLEWSTPKENTIHAHCSGLINQRGERNNGSKLKESDIYKILKLREDGLSFSEIGRLFNVCRKTISNIFYGKTWTHMTNIKKCND